MLIGRALAANPAARAGFDTLDRQNRYVSWYRIQDATKPETRPTGRHANVKPRWERPGLAQQNQAVPSVERL
jgi:hypothetical protein